MGVTKTESFSDIQNELASMAKALAHPARIAILEHLLEINTCVCGDLVNVIDLAQPTISQHLKELKTAGLIKGSIEGTRVCYCIDEERWNAVADLLQQFFARRSPKAASCC
jgi:ArsR family transcriptional regulator